ncbi:hypothetical protein KGA66_03440 [Actinocrinis puniceicyclus]|uniref:Uncharacterized protein n=1 Tax=Actinocrinis puniceicyclus TaxID=977794 RepID=A0A8J7WLV9_9ACTN|nr:hypothetical protein [Actinocrinis puniceicyclus]
MLGFGGHFAAKSRGYSTTLGALRQERADYTARRDPLTLALVDSPDVLVVNHWNYAGPADQPSSSTPQSGHTDHSPDPEGGPE